MNRIQKIVLGLVFLVLSLTLTTACQKGETVTRSDFTLDTIVTITLYDQKDQNLLNEAFTELKRLDTLLSAYNEKSEISAINAKAGQSPVAVSRETFEVIQKGLAYGHLTDGAFDITIGPLVDLWNIGENTEVPAESEIEYARSLVDYRKVVLDEEKYTVFLQDPNMKINLGAVAKGYIGQQLKGFLTERGVTHGILNLGGNVVLIGEKDRGQPFGVSVEDPDNLENTIGVLGISDCAAVTSGDYQRFFIGSDGQRYHHILDPQTGYPAESEFRQVTIVTSDSTDADILSTACFILGLDRSLALVEQVPETEVIFVTKAHEILKTGEGKYPFQVNQENQEYQYEEIKTE